MGTEKRQRQKEGRQARLEAERAAQVKQRRTSTLRNVVIVVALFLAAMGAYSFLTKDDSSTKTTVTTTAPTSGSTTPPTTAKTGGTTSPASTSPVTPTTGAPTSSTTTPASTTTSANS